MRWDERCVCRKCVWWWLMIIVCVWALLCLVCWVTVRCWYILDAEQKASQSLNFSFGSVSLGFYRRVFMLNKQPSVLKSPPSSQRTTGAQTFLIELELMRHMCFRGFSKNPNHNLVQSNKSIELKMNVEQLKSLVDKYVSSFWDLRLLIRNILWQIWA